MYLPSLSNAELVRHAEAVRDPLTTTDLEIELCNRLADTDDLEALRDLARWLYRQLEAEYDHLTSDEAIEEGIIVNEYTFTEAGRRFG